MNQPADRRQALTFIDAHVHLHPCYALDATLDVAYRNFAMAAEHVTAEGSFTGLLMLTEKPNANVFETLIERGAVPRPDGWSATPTGEANSLRLRRGDGRELLITAGQQIEAAEDLEVLAIGLRPRLPSGRPIREVIQSVADAGAIPILAWGFGKWTGRRGALIDQLLSDSELPEFYLGDNGGRLRVMTRDRRIASAEAAGRPVLSGSDPPPFRNGFRRVGAFGFWIEGELDPERPFASFVERLREADFRPRGYGAGESAVTFVTQQLRMQVRKRLRR